MKVATNAILRYGINALNKALEKAGVDVEYIDELDGWQVRLPPKEPDPPVLVDQYTSSMTHLCTTTFVPGNGSFQVVLHPRAGVVRVSPHRPAKCTTCMDAGRIPSMVFGNYVPCPAVGCNAGATYGKWVLLNEHPNSKKMWNKECRYEAPGSFRIEFEPGSNKVVWNATDNLSLQCDYTQPIADLLTALHSAMLAATSAKG